MRRTTIMASDDLIGRIRRMAAERGVPVAVVIREALEEKVKSYWPRPRSLGAGASGHPDTARCAGEERPEPRAWL
jgi:hypothetical protein